MYIPISRKRLAHIVRTRNHIITWCGAQPQSSILVHTESSGVRYKYEVDINNAYNNLELGYIVRNGEAQVPLETVSPTPPNKRLFLRAEESVGIGHSIGRRLQCGGGPAQRERQRVRVRIRYRAIPQWRKERRVRTGIDIRQYGCI